ncbi:hypothetical protein [Nocardia lijiangensis]|uniref:hypothetical protein n=1 Tax=Nocardia lijiangensis TaxID=299618 RepID=UPI003D73B78A
MSTDATDSDLFDAYVTEAILIREHTTVPAGLEIPVYGRRIRVQVLRAVLEDPRLLTHTCGLELPELLVAFALWLDHPPTGQVMPPDCATMAIRFRFMVWSLTTRHTGWQAPIYPDQIDMSDLSPWPLPTSPTLEEFGSARLQAEARTARHQWLTCLTRWEDDPWLATRTSAQLENDLRWLRTTWPSQRPHRTTTAPDWPQPATELRLGSDDDITALADELAQLWLERGSVIGASHTLTPTDPDARIATIARRFTVFAYPSAASVVVALLLCGHVGSARIAAPALLAAGLLAAVCSPRRYLPLAVLRIPAAATVGIALLLTLTPAWWVNTWVWPIGVALIGAAAIYLILEARQHGTSHFVAIRRGLILTTLGVLHAAVLSIAALGFVIPAMGEHGRCMSGWWNHPVTERLPLSTESPGFDADPCVKALRSATAAAPLETLTLMTGWSLAFGLGTQILWDDRPVTAPLGRIRRTRGTP